MKRRLVIIGAGDLGQQIAHYVTTDDGFEVVGFYDDFQKTGSVVNGVIVLGSINEIAEHYSKSLFDELIIGIGYKHLSFKEELYHRFKNQIPLATIVHSSCIVDPTAIIGEGTIIYPGCIIDQQSKIGDNVVANIGCCIAHDSEVGHHSFLSPRVAIAGFVKIGQRNIIGINSTIIDNITTVTDVQLGGGSVVIQHIERKGLYVGNPTRFIR